MKRGQDPRWPKAHVNLKRLYEERITPTGMTQEQFGAQYDIGSQAMVWQLLNGYVPLPYEVAVKFTMGLRCTIRDISPEMDEWMKGFFLPALGVKIRKRVAAALLALVLFPAASPDAISHNQDSDRLFSPKSLVGIHILGLWFRILKLFRTEQLAVLTKPITRTVHGWFWHPAPSCSHP
jgi:hypothetical protein